eukprot:TRINITY_DN894_c0_g2_i3.p1 TRINITY_DN894_c0_g2~~TRINITY_DN894_c0_g2_i3.p1  ORF type:complete len:355 (-),score=46.39 TRINITY_DN894_c0_g2_i3:2-1033(-)
MEESDDETVASDISEVKKLQKSVKTVDSDGWGHSESFLESLKANQTKKRSETLRQFAEFKAELCKHTDAATLRSCQSFKDDVSSRQKEFDTVFAQELADDALVGVPLARFAEISELIQSWAPQATALAARLDTQLHDLEVQRKQSLEQLLRSLHESLSKLQHPVEHDIVAPIKDEIEEYNLCAVKNRTFRAQLKCRFLKDEAVRRHGLASRLTARLAAAKRVQHDHAVATAQQTLASAAFLDPPERRMVLTAPTAAHLEFVEALDAQVCVHATRACVVRVFACVAAFRNRVFCLSRVRSLISGRRGPTFEHLVSRSLRERAQYQAWNLWLVNLKTVKNDRYKM